jgi:hypothetical protein
MPSSSQASKGYVNILRQLLKAGARVNAKDKTGSSPLHRAASAGKYDAALVLLEEGHAKVDSHDKTGSTALLVAVSCKESNIAILLASKGANLEVSCWCGCGQRGVFCVWFFVRRVACDQPCCQAAVTGLKQHNTQAARVISTKHNTRTSCNSC